MAPDLLAKLGSGTGPKCPTGEGKRAGEAKRPKTGLGPRTLVLWPTSSPTGLPTLALTSSLSSQLRPAHLWLPSKETRTAQDPPNRDSGLRGWVTPAVSSVTCLGEVEMTQVGTTPSWKKPGIQDRLEMKLTLSWFETSL